MYYVFEYFKRTHLLINISPLSIVEFVDTSVYFYLES